MKLKIIIILGLIIILAYVFISKVHRNQSTIGNKVPFQDTPSSNIQKPMPQPSSSPKQNLIHKIQSSSNESLIEQNKNNVNHASLKKTNQQKPDECFTITYVHKKIQSHADGEVCLTHNNLLALKPKSQNPIEGTINPKSICVFVDGSAVKHSNILESADKIMFGPSAGPHSKVQAQFCIGHGQCKNLCKIEKDEFMSAIGAEDQKDGQQPGWDGSKELSKEESDLESETTALNQERLEIEAKPTIFEGWIAEKVNNTCLNN